jgi:hypothetical protein
VEKSKRFDLSAYALHLMAMGLMLLDHLWATLLPQYDILTCLGRIAFPIFAFLAVEGYFHTHDLRRYLLRLLVGAILSEVPFDLMTNGVVFYPFHQNVLWTYLIGLLCVHLAERTKAKGKPALTVLSAVGAVVLGYLAGTVGMVDYYGAGVLTVLCFYFLRGRNWQCLAGQILVLGWINIALLQGRYYPVTVLGREVELYQQSLALLALVPIWLYRGRQGRHSKPFQMFCYGFYPVHMLVLALLWGA